MSKINYRIPPYRPDICWNDVRYRHLYPYGKAYLPWQEFFLQLQSSFSTIRPGIRKKAESSGQASHIPFHRMACFVLNIRRTKPRFATLNRWSYGADLSTQYHSLRSVHRHTSPSSILHCHSLRRNVGDHLPRNRCRQYGICRHRLSTKLNALRVTSGLPILCRCIGEKSPRSTEGRMGELFYFRRSG